MELNQHIHHSQPRLNFDVLHLVCNYLTDVSDALSFALTCSTLRRGALQRRLRMSPVVLSSSVSVSRFYRFIFADAVARAPYIHGLKLFCAGFDPEKHRSRLDLIHNRLVALLEAATHIEGLYTTAAMDGPILIAAAKLTTLRELSVLSEADSHPEVSRRFLTAVRSPLRYLHIPGHLPGEGLLSPSFLHDQLAHFAPTLEVLDVQYFTLDTSPSSVTTPFTAMRSLKTNSIRDFYKVDVLLRLFPNLQDIFIAHGPERLNTTEYAVIRQRNKEAQKTCTWSRLDRVVCTTLSAYLMALQCPIHHMDISQPVLDMWLNEPLRVNSPRQLSFHLVLYDRFLGLRTLDGRFPSEAAGRLSHLVMLLACKVHRAQPTMVRSDPFSWDQLMDKLIDVMKHLRLTHLRIVFDYDVYQGDGGPTQRNRAAFDDDEFLNMVRGADLHAAATRFFDAIPTLQYVFLTTCGHTYLPTRAGTDWSQKARRKWSSSKAWQVDDVNEELHWSDRKRVSCVEISSETAKVVMDREALYLVPEMEDNIRQCSDPLSK
ncbi:hypothetical protein LXA43DRAFT_1184920 [Ganoderma leucocontextum]|nr:hypothetical protein LXA43DRAFT_1184920 [Ganoderma leucocontextum]